jgi:2-polyprenyl-3-methyl-5-hydroxy-6-metoxy-1,4-benzoquinol methylase
MPLSGARILEIGCGTGASTVALAEQGAQVTAVDLDGSALEVARVRCDAYGVRATFIEANAVDAIQPADMIVFFACLEHMTYEERIESLRKAWEVLPPHGILAVVDTPNRLWYFDGHTALTPFFNWLPHELAME